MKDQRLLAVLRICMGFIFLWAFLDKLLGLGFATAPDKSWFSGNSPTFGFLKFGADGIFKSFFESLAGNIVVDYLLMFGLFGIGTALLLGIARKLTTFFGTVLLVLLWLSLYPPENNPLVDDHIIYILVLQVLYRFHDFEELGIGKWWQKTALVKKYPIMQ